MELGQLPPGPTGEAAKAFGAYYTDATVARLLVRWALRSPHDTLADPSFGGGVFLATASERIQQLGGDARRQIFGVELDQEVYGHTATMLDSLYSINRDHLICGDFFDVQPQRLRLNAVVGNPPFIRYQRFTGAGRDKAIRRAAEQGVILGKLSSSWAAFVVHSAALLYPGGRLGLVIPAELGHAAYARPVLQYLARSFEHVTLLTFRKKLFPALSQDVLLLLAEGRRSYAEPTAVFALLDLHSASDLEALHLPHPNSQILDTPALTSSRKRLLEYWIPHTARELYQDLRDSPQTFHLGEIADVGIGYVTGNNDFFHLSPEQAQQWSIPQEFLNPAVRRGRILRGLRFTQADWDVAVQKGEAGFLLHISPTAELPSGLRQYLQQGQVNRIHRAYKCRVRQPWYAVPHVYQPDAFLTYMSGETPRLVANEARVVAPNTLHTLRLKFPPALQVGGGFPFSRATAHTPRGWSAKAVAVLWQTSLTRLSAEIEGHPMGGGMLKIEPGEAEKIVLPRFEAGTKKLEHLADELHRLIKNGQVEQAQNLADQLILREGLGMAEKDVVALSQASQYLSLRRQRKLAGL
ncbi:N-6 DNA methylase [uncultured Meiothermus sp.]|jgi:adenine-specific DNA methylase|uniref:N-6 DNA methylase n=1 Tax=uncultured Meiothermus sp. TaxID=157471 RepID=UPI002602B2C7|nr:N-6 DNA methylase [uncultured Meiothermus sp.]